MGFGPTIRIFARRTRWCELEPEDNSAAAMFEALLGHAHE
jgi:hypothetical protein